MDIDEIDTLLRTTRSVRKRLDLERPVPRGVVEECLALAQQAPTGGNRQLWSFVVVTDPATRSALAEIYRKGWDRYVTEGMVEPRPRRRRTRSRGPARSASGRPPSTWPTISSGCPCW